MKVAFRFSIKQLLLWTAGVAVAIALASFFLRNASNSWSSLAFWGTATLLTLALLVAVNRSGAKRAWWLGFAICGWSYFVLVSCDIARTPVGMPEMLNQDHLVTSRINNRIYLALYAPPSPPVFVPGPPTKSGRMTGSFMPPTGQTNFIDIDDFIRVGHLLWAIALAFCGGWVSVLLHLTRREPQEATP